MLSAEELDKLFDLLENIHGRKGRRDVKTMTVWLEVTRPWSYEQVRQAAIARAQTGVKFFPDPPELAAFCPPPEEGQEAGRRDSRPPAGWEKQRALLERFSALKQRRREVGLPASLEEARRAGLSAKEWLDALDEAGLSTAQWLLEGGGNEREKTL